MERDLVAEVPLSAGGARCPRPRALEVPLVDTFDCDLRLAIEDISAGVANARGSQCLAESPAADFISEVLDDIDSDCVAIREELHGGTELVPCGAKDGDAP